MIQMFSASDVFAGLDPARCADAVEAAMIELSTGRHEQPLRQIIPIAPAKLFAVMPGLLIGSGLVGTKVVTAYPSTEHPSRSEHRGLVMGFDSETGLLLGTADAGAVTAVRTAVASAVATRALANPGWSHLALLGTGEQALSHARIFHALFDLDRITLWGRSARDAENLAAALHQDLGVEIDVASTAAEAAGRAEVLCTLTSASEPILHAADIRPGTHINAVGSSFNGPMEIATDLVAISRYVVDCRPYANIAASEFIAARKAGVIDDDHVVGEIGQILANDVEGRRSPADVTLYKSLGHIVQDLAALKCLLAQGATSSSPAMT